MYQKLQTVHLTGSSGCCGEKRDRFLLFYSGGRKHAGPYVANALPLFKINRGEREVRNSRCCSRSGELAINY